VTDCREREQIAKATWLMWGRGTLSAGAGHRITTFDLPPVVARLLMNVRPPGMP
jgi:hypothetical protein